MVNFIYMNTNMECTENIKTSHNIFFIIIWNGKCFRFLSLFHEIIRKPISTSCSVAVTS